MPTSTANAPELAREQVQAILVQPLMATSVFLAAGPASSMSPHPVPSVSRNWLGWASPTGTVRMN
jgi:hypothetical protein